MQRDLDPFEQQEEGGGAMSFDRAISAVLKRIKLVIAIPVVLATLVALFVLAIPNRYSASAIIQIDARQKSITNMVGIVSELKADSSSIESEVEIIQSRPIILKVINALDLRNDPEFTTPPLLSRILTRLGLRDKYQAQRAPKRETTSPDEIAQILDPEQPGSSRPERDGIAEAFLSRLRVARIRNTLLIEICFSATSAPRAAQIANTIAEVYLREQLEGKTRGTATAAKLLEQKIDEMRAKVAIAERKVAEWKADHNVFDSEGQDLSEKELSRLMEQIVSARNATSEARAKYNLAQKLVRQGDSANTLADVLQSATIRSLKQQLADADRKIAELGTKYGPKHPDIIKVKAERAEAQSQMRLEVDRLIANLRNEVDVAQGRERQLAQNMADLKEQQVVTKDQSVELKALERDAESSKQLYEALLVRYKQTAETKEFQLPDVRIIEKADTPLFHTTPKRKQLVLMSAAAGTILAIAIALLLELMTPGITRQDEIERVFDTAHLASIPPAASDGQPVAPAKAIRLVVAEPLSPYADAIRNARRELDMHRTNRQPRIILVASSVAGEGSELIASNLAHNYAMTGGRPLLIDGDARLQPLTRQLAAERPGGMLDQIIKRQPLERAILHDGVTGLNFLPAAGPGPLSRPIPETLNSNDCAAALTGLKAHFDTIVISAPPLLPVIDGRILSDYADQIVFVVAWQKTPRQLAKAALKALGINDRKLSGIVLNDVAPEALEQSRGWPAGLFGGIGKAKVAGARRYSA